MVGSSGHNHTPHKILIIGDLVGLRYFVLKNKGIGNISAYFLRS